MGPLASDTVYMENARVDACQALLSRGGQQTGQLLQAMVEKPAAQRRLMREAIKNASLSFSSRALTTSLPWSFVRHSTPADVLMDMGRHFSAS
jgi:hypothetical protein